MTGSTVHTTPMSLMSDEAQQYLTVKLNTGATSYKASCILCV